MAGKNGLENAVVMLVEPKKGQPFRLMIAPNGIWSSAGLAQSGVVDLN
jgi:hypothetical protein